MRGTVTKRDWRGVAREFGLWKALRLLLTRNKVALNILMATMAFVIMAQGHQGQNVIWYVDTDRDSSVDTKILLEWDGARGKLVELDRRAITGWHNPIKPLEEEKK